MRHMLPVDEDDYDCSIELQLPEESKEAVAEVAEAEGPEEAAEQGRPAKRAKQGGGAGTVLVLQASSVALKQHSEVFR